LILAELAPSGVECKSPVCGSEWSTRTRAQYLHGAVNVGTSLSTETLPIVSTAVVGKVGQPGKKAYKLEELMGKGMKAPFKLIEWDGLLVQTFH